jgi:hypothetical protein
MDRLQQLFDQFLRERIYLHNVTPKTRDWYESAWKAFLRTRTEAQASASTITRADLAQFVMQLRSRGVRPVCLQHMAAGLECVLPVAP